MSGAPRILHLTLHRIWFDLIARGAKRVEYREMTPHWKSRLEGKKIDLIHFRNGYSADRPFMVVECCDITISDGGQYAIALGKVLEIKNWEDKTDGKAIGNG